MKVEWEEHGNEAHESKAYVKWSANVKMNRLKANLLPTEMLTVLSQGKTLVVIVVVIARN